MVLMFLIPILLRRNFLQLLRTMHETVRVSFWHDPSLVWLLHKVLIALFLSESYRILFALEVEMGPLQKIRGRLPAH